MKFSDFAILFLVNFLNALRVNSICQCHLFIWVWLRLNRHIHGVIITKSIMHYRISSVSSFLWLFTSNFTGIDHRRPKRLEAIFDLIRIWVGIWITWNNTSVNPSPYVNLFYFIFNFIILCDVCRFPLARWIAGLFRTYIDPSIVRATQRQRTINVVALTCCVNKRRSHWTVWRCFGESEGGEIYHKIIRGRQNIRKKLVQTGR